MKKYLLMIFYNTIIVQNSLIDLYEVMFIKEKKMKNEDYFIAECKVIFNLKDYKRVVFSIKDSYQ